MCVKGIVGKIVLFGKYGLKNNVMEGMCTHVRGIEPGGIQSKGTVIFWKTADIYKAY